MNADLSRENLGRLRRFVDRNAGALEALATFRQAWLGFTRQIEGLGSKPLPTRPARRRKVSR